MIKQWTSTHIKAHSPETCHLPDKKKDNCLMGSWNKLKIPFSREYRWSQLKSRSETSTLENDDLRRMLQLIWKCKHLKTEIKGRFSYVLRYAVNTKGSWSFAVLQQPLETAYWEATVSIMTLATLLDPGNKSSHTCGQSNAI